ncbi:hypothetical protein Nepgr_015940 [Nepenthes gracilis]|uniref:DUF7798 domain-containing protein n=1 Tax=Nepenthes gracilis TaxID=150966 RepID=A0AAD3XRK6_NEPGR|nr:hypothetical protein Nepgr_015940 [Nepenthes gracilis]
MWQIAFAAGHCLLSYWSCHYITVVCMGDRNVYEVTKFSQLEKQSFPYSVGRFTWSETPGPSLQHAKSLTCGGNKGAVLNVPATFTTLAGMSSGEAESKALGQPERAVRDLQELPATCDFEAADLLQLVGTNAVVYYFTSVFHSVGIAYDVAASALVGAANVLGAATASLLMGKQGRKSLLITSSKHFASGAWQAVGSALIGSPKFIHKLEHSAMNLAESLQHGGGDADDQFYEDMTFDKCFYIYGGPEQLQELRSFYEGRLKAVQRLQNVVWR